MVTFPSKVPYVHNRLVPNIQVLMYNPMSCTQQHYTHTMNTGRNKLLHRELGYREYEVLWQMPLDIYEPQVIV